METRTNETTFVEVRNRNNGYTGYVLPNGLVRNFTINQIRKIDIEELRELRDCDGGEYILRNYLVIKDKPALEYLDINPEPEYFYTDKEVKELLANGTLDQLEDALNFAPQGVIDLIKDIAVKTELPDTRKRDLISEKTGFGITAAIEINKAMNEDTKKAEEKPVRKATPVAETASGRKAEPIKVEEAPKSKYKVID